MCHIKRYIIFTPVTLYRIFIAIITVIAPHTHIQHNTNTYTHIRNRSIRHILRVELARNDTLYHLYTIQPISTTYPLPRLTHSLTLNHTLSTTLAHSPIGHIIAFVYNIIWYIRFWFRLKNTFMRKQINPSNAV